jgi:16S rRNA (cytosine1402-N4)-methyltransferase
VGGRHQPVLLDEVIVQLAPLPGQVVVDGTVGGGGHAEEVLKESAPDGLLIGLDVDGVAAEQAKFRLARYAGRVKIARASYAEIGNVLAGAGIPAVDGILLDLGVSSLQLDEPERGFSFQADAPLDMRMDDRAGVTAEYVVNEVSRDQLRRILFEYGEEPMAGAIADRIVASRRRDRIRTTGELTRIVEEVCGGRGRRVHPATRTFQAIRMEVNRELEHLRRFLAEFPAWMAKGGRVVVISFHSLEDRLVKERFRELARVCVCPPEVPRCVCGQKPQVELLTKKAVRPTETETERNPRSRSARLRAVRKL